ncbi:MAG TPA: hypothetical protein DC001_00100, partial [Clostridiales bacterium]|nr:hypothetical protein [Clostridiales bacterium]
EKHVTVTAAEAGAEITAADAAVAAYNYGHDGNIFSNLAIYIKCLFGDNDITVTAEADKAVVREKVEEAVSEVTDGLLTSGVKIEDDAVLVVKGAKAVSIDTDAICTMIAEALENRNYGECEYEVQVEEAVELDIDELYESIHTEPQDAYYDSEAGEIVESVKGYDFDKSEAERLWASADYGD